MNRRVFLVTATAGFAAIAKPQSSEIPETIRSLKPMTDGIQPITDDERRARMEKARKLMRNNKIGAVVMEGGSSLYYFTGARWPASDKTFAWILPANGDPVFIVPAAAEAHASESIHFGGTVRAWQEADGPFGKIAQFLKERGATGRIGIEERTRFAIFDGIRRESPTLKFVSADPVTAGCRVIKSPAEIALLQRANDITIACYRAVFPTFREGMTQREVSANISAAYKALGVQGNAMAIFGKYTAFPHGSIQPQKLQSGDLVLVDDGCTVEGYQSDITRTTIFGKPTQRQRDVWNLERKAQDAALNAVKVGATCESVDAAARKVITDAGFGPGYKLPGLPHRTGHGIGLDGHEWTNLVKGNKTKLQPGMCFSNEPTIAIYGEFGVRLEDCMYITETGARMFTKQSPAIDQPFG
ncbi:MAG TPA: Xaa-Pro peptidase family protein [Bryobacteraceae bacterium]|nr:Xaa-Pro peptidase family protein [Bryobacteraceae bacterium]